MPLGEFFSLANGHAWAYIALIINFGDHKDVYEKLCQKIHGIQTTNFFNEYTKLKYFVNEIKKGDASGIYAIYNKDIFEAVYSTNLLMPVTDLLITKPSELAYYPIPKLFMRHIGGHEVYGGINGREYGHCSGCNAMIDISSTPTPGY